MEISYLMKNSSFSVEISYLPKPITRNKAEGIGGRNSALSVRKMPSLSYSGSRSFHTSKDFSGNQGIEFDIKSSANFDIEKIRSLKYSSSNTRFFAITEPLEAELDEEGKAQIGDDNGSLKRNGKTVITTQGIEQVLHMMGGIGENSYAKNSRIQSKGIMKAKPIVEEALKQVYMTLTPKKFVAVDMACSSGSNTLLVVSEIINTINRLSRQLGLRAPEVQMFLNDLPGNDFNAIFRSLADYEKKIREEENFLPFHVVGSPGSFYTRLFPSKSVHFFHSSYGQMWLSKVPEGVDGENCPYLGNEDFYKKQFKKDFSTFLKLRSKELIFGGRVVLVISGGRNNPKFKDMAYLWGLLSVALNDMISEGLLEEDERKAVNFPFHTPTMEEIKSIIQAEGSFHLHQVQAFELSWDPSEEIGSNIRSDYVLRGKAVANYIRAAAEPLLDRHFDRETLDELFSRYAKLIASHLKEKPKWVSFILDLKLKE